MMGCYFLKCAFYRTGTARYRGMGKMHTQNLMEAICYNLYRISGIVDSNIKKQRENTNKRTAFA
tara:strand:- start:7433 stop:7624 length:192 start_codon:yes stop_codon:yes gene_type:complete